jgi:hypothetical protein
MKKPLVLGLSLSALVTVGCHRGGGCPEGAITNKEAGYCVAMPATFPAPQTGSEDGPGVKSYGYYGPDGASITITVKTGDEATEARWEATSRAMHNPNNGGATGIARQAELPNGFFVEQTMSGGLSWGYGYVHKDGKTVVCSTAGKTGSDEKRLDVCKSLRLL